MKQSIFRLQTIRAAPRLTTLVFSGLILTGASDLTAAPDEILAKDSFLTSDTLGPDRDFAWFKENIPFFDCPDARGGDKIRQTYYYRWRVMKNHLRHTRESGYVFTEFIGGDNWRASDPFVRRSYSAINAGAGFVIDEARWLRDRRFSQDYIKHFLGGNGRLMEYTDWIGDALWSHYLVTGDANFTRAHLPHLVSVFTLRKAIELDAKTGLFHTRPCVDAMETNSTALKYGEGVRTLRPTYASYMFGYAQAIAKIATLAGDQELQLKYEAEAKALKAALQRELWNPEQEIFMEKLVGNGNWAPAPELIGYVPWAFHAAEDREDCAATWRHLIDAEKFDGPYGLRSSIKGSEFYFKDRGRNTCTWNGPSWPFLSSAVLAGIANVLNDYKHKGVLTPEIYHEQLLKFTLQHYKDGKPYLAESYNPDTGVWWCDIAGRSEDYLHSKYIDLIITGLVGMRPGEGDSFTVNPLIPKEWNHFCLQSVPYKGRSVTIVYDMRDKGQRYRLGGSELRSGLTVYVDGKIRGYAVKLQPLKVAVAPLAIDPPAGDVNYAFRDYRFIGTSGFPSVSASFQGQQNPYEVIDGTVLYYKDKPRNRFTFEASPNKEDHLTIDLGEDKPITVAKLYFYDDGERLRCPASYRIEYATAAAPDQFKELGSHVSAPDAPAPNAVNTMKFKQILARKWRITFTHAADSRTAMCEVSLTGSSVDKTPAAYRDYFADDRPGTEASGWIGHGGAWFIRQSKRYGVDRGDDCKAVLVLNTGNFTNYRNFRYSADVLVCDVTGHAGLIFRAENVSEDPNAFSGWYAGIGGGKLILGRADGTKFEVVAESPVDLKPNAVSKLRVDVIERDGRDLIHVFLNQNEKPVIEHKIKMTKQSSGVVGLRACKTAAEYGNIRVELILDGVEKQK